MRILIADDSPAARSEVRSSLASHEEWEVCAEASTGEDAVVLSRQLRPDLLILDANLPGIGSLNAARAIRQNLPGVDLLVLTRQCSRSLLYEFLRLGVLAFVRKLDVERDLSDAIEAVRRREHFMSRYLDALLPSSARTTPVELLLADRQPLTSAERAQVRSVAAQLRQLL